MAFTVTHPEFPVTDRHAPMAEWCLDHGYRSEQVKSWAGPQRDGIWLELAESIASLEAARTPRLRVVR